MTKAGRRSPALTDESELLADDRPSPNDLQPAFPETDTPRDPDLLSKRKANAIEASNTDPEAQNTAAAVRNLSTND